MANAAFAFEYRYFSFTYYFFGKAYGGSAYGVLTQQVI